MARKVYFAFHFERDIFRVNVVRNSNVVLGVEEAGFRDQSEYDEVMRKTPEAIARHLLERMKGTSVTAVLIGRETWQRPWVNWEIQQSIANKNGLLGVYIHHVSSLGEADSIWAVPTLPAVPTHVPFPVIYWNTSDLTGFAREVEAAGQRADQQRLYPTMFAAMDSKCTNCGTVNQLKTPQPDVRYMCGKCGHPLPPFTASGDTSMAVGMLGGAALGAAVGGPVGAVVGAIGGALLGKGAKGVG